MTTEQAFAQFDHFIDSHNGIYSAQVFAERLNEEFKAGKIEGIDNEGWQILLDGPDNTDYVEVWVDELENIVITDLYGKRWLVYENEGIYLYPEEIHDQVNWDEMYF